LRGNLQPTNRESYGSIVHNEYRSNGHGTSIRCLMHGRGVRRNCARTRFRGTGGDQSAKDACELKTKSSSACVSGNATGNRGCALPKRRSMCGLPKFACKRCLLSLSTRDNSDRPRDNLRDSPPQTMPV